MKAYHIFFAAAVLTSGLASAQEAATCAGEKPTAESICAKTSYTRNTYRFVQVLDTLEQETQSGATFQMLKVKKWKPADQEWTKSNSWIHDGQLTQ